MLGDRQLAALTARPARVELGPGPDPQPVIAGLTPADRPAVLSGRWFGGGVMIMVDPVVTTGWADWSTVATRLDAQPTAAPDPAETGDLVGGGWVCLLGFDPGTSTAAFYDQLLRYRPGRGWTFEHLGLPGREEAVAAGLARWRAALAQPPTPPEPPTPLLTPPPTGTEQRYTVAPFGSVAVPGPENPADPDDAYDTPQARHLAGVERVVGLIDRGELYQMNLCTRFGAAFDGSPAAMFADVARGLQPDRGAMIMTEPGRSLVSLSPELFLSARADRVTAAPIKGTSSRADDPDGSVLRASTKDAAENVMITDLMRNDLSRVCRPGSVAVPTLLDLEAHPGVWHLVSTVTGQLAPGTTPSDLLAATFPPGSVTGAPKHTALSGIAALEPAARQAYTGALGLLSPIAGTDLSVVIRTFEITGDRIELGVGGGITVDSVPVREWHECLHKAAPLVTAAGSVLGPDLVEESAPVPPDLAAAGLIETLLSRRGRVLRAAAHLARLERSCRELYGRPPPEDLADRVRDAVAGTTLDRLGVRVTVTPPADPSPNPELQVRIEAWPAAPAATGSDLVLGRRPPWSWRHKWADRSSLTAAETAAGPALPYFLAPAGWVAETSRGSVFLVHPDGSWSTPPTDDHLLPGVTRRDLLDALSAAGVTVRLRRFGPAAFATATAAVWTSSLSGLVPIRTVDGLVLPTPPPSVVGLWADLRRRLGFSTIGAAS